MRHRIERNPPPTCPRAVALHSARGELSLFLLHYLPPGQMLALHHFVSTCAPANSACDERLSGSPRFPSLHVPRANGPSP